MALISYYSDNRGRPERPYEFITDGWTLYLHRLQKPINMTLARMYAYSICYVIHMKKKGRAKPSTDQSWRAFFLVFDDD